MPPRIDPYANKTHRRIDVALIILTLILIFFAFRYSANSRSAADPTRVERATASNSK